MMGLMHAMCLNQCMVSNAQTDPLF